MHPTVITTWTCRPDATGDATGNATGCLTGLMKATIEIPDALDRHPVTAVAVDDERIEFILSDGRAISAPVTWSARLVKASVAERADGRVMIQSQRDDTHRVWALLKR